MPAIWTVVVRIVAKILGPILALVTAAFREELIEFVKERYKKALETENPWDDFFFKLLADMFAIKL